VPPAAAGTAGRPAAGGATTGSHARAAIVDYLIVQAAGDTGQDQYREQH
jgi:hypothetical protein